MKCFKKILNYFSFIFLLILCLSLTVYAQSINMNKVTGSAGNNVSFTVSLNNTTSIESLGLDITYDPSVLNYIDYNEGNLTQNFDFFSGNLLQDGQLRIGGFTVNPIQPGSSGSLVSLNFTVLKTQNSNLAMTNLLDDIAGYSVVNGQLQKPATTSLPTGGTTTGGWTIGGASTFPALGGGFPSLGGGLPALGGGFPSLGGGFGSFGGSFPALGGGFPSLGGSFPSLGGGFPSLGGSFPSLGGGFPSLGGGFGSLGGGFGSLGGSFPSFGGGFPSMIGNSLGFGLTSFGSDNGVGIQPFSWGSSIW